MKLLLERIAPMRRVDESALYPAGLNQAKSFSVQVGVDLTQ